MHKLKGRWFIIMDVPYHKWVWFVVVKWQWWMSKWNGLEVIWAKCRCKYVSQFTPPASILFKSSTFERVWCGQSVWWALGLMPLCDSTVWYYYGYCVIFFFPISLWDSCGDRPDRLRWMSSYEIIHPWVSALKNRFYSPVEYSNMKAINSMLEALPHHAWDLLLVS